MEINVVRYSVWSLRLVAFMVACLAIGQRATTRAAKDAPTRLVYCAQITLADNHSAILKISEAIRKPTQEECNDATRHMKLYKAKIGSLSREERIRRFGSDSISSTHTGTLTHVRETSLIVIVDRKECAGERVIRAWVNPDEKAEFPYSVLDVRCADNHLCVLEHDGSRYRIAVYNVDPMRQEVSRMAYSIVATSSAVGPAYSRGRIRFVNDRTAILVELGDSVTWKKSETISVRF